MRLKLLKKLQHVVSALAFKLDTLALQTLRNICTLSDKPLF